MGISSGNGRVVYIACWLAFVCTSAARAEEELAVSVFNRIGPSVVCLESVSGFGSGLVLDEDGTILTCAHVVAIPLPYRCRAEVVQGGERVSVVFNRVKVVSVHPELDLALVKIDPAEHDATLLPGHILDRKAQTGQQVFAVGNPAEGNERLTKTITSGLLSGVDRQLEGSIFYQFSAAVNSGNSGGPLCDREGNVLGLVTFKSSSSENVGFAVPLYDLATDEFKPPQESPTNPVEALRLFELSKSYWQRYSEANPSLKPDGAGQSYRHLAMRCLQESLALDPRNATTCAHIAVQLFFSEEYAAAEGCFWTSLQLDSWQQSPLVYEFFGRLKVMQGSEDQAEILWREGAAKHPQASSPIWRRLVEFYERREDWVRSAYFARRSLSTNSDRLVGNVDSDQSYLRTLGIAEGRDWTRIINNNRDEGIDDQSHLSRRNLALRRDDWAVTSAFAEFVKESGYELPPPDLASDPELILAIRKATYRNALAEMRKKLVHDWRIEAGNLISPAEGFSTLVIPPETLQGTAEGYSLQLVVERLSGTKELVIGFTRGEESLAIAIDAEETGSGFVGLPQGFYEKVVLERGKPVSLIVEVTGTTVRVLVDGIGAFRHEGPLDAPPANESLRIGRVAPLFVGSRDSGFAIRSFDVVSGHAQPLPPPPPAVAATPPSEDGARPRPSRRPRPEAVAHTPAFRRFPNMLWGVDSLAFSPDGRFLAVGKPDEAVMLFDLERGQICELKERLRYMGNLTCCGFSPDGSRFFAGGEKGAIETWDVSPEGALTVRTSFTAHDSKIRCFAVSPDGTHMLSADYKELCYWNVETRREVFSPPALTGRPKAVHISADGLLAAMSDGQELIWFELPSGELEDRLDLAQLGGAQHCAAFSADGRRFVMDLHYSVHIHSATTGQLESTFEEGELIRAVAFTPDGNRLITALRGKCHVWDLATGMRLQEIVIEADDAYVGVLAVSADSRYLATAPTRAGATVQVFELPD